MEFHTIEPIYDKNSKILILGSFPSVKSREANFFYGHPQNRFWKVLANVMNDVCPGTTEEKKAFLIKHNIAVWDVIASCDIEGSSDSSIKNVTPNDLRRILQTAEIKIYITGTDDKLLEQLKENHDIVITVEDGVLDGGFGEKIARFYGNSDVKVLNYGLKKEFLDRYNPEEIVKANRLTPEQIAEDVCGIIG